MFFPPYTIDDIVRASRDPRLRGLAESLARNQSTREPPVTPEELNDFTECARRLALANDEVWRIIFEKIDRITNAAQEINDTMSTRTETYDWTKLPPDWRFDPKAGILLNAATPGLGYHPSEHKLVFLGSGHDSYTLDELDQWDDMAREQLKRCQIEVPPWYEAARLRLEKAGFQVELKNGGLTATKPETSMHVGLTIHLREADKPMRIDDVLAMNDAVAIAAGIIKGGDILGPLRDAIEAASLGSLGRAGGEPSEY